MAASHMNATYLFISSRFSTKKNAPYQVSSLRGIPGLVLSCDQILLRIKILFLFLFFLPIALTKKEIMCSLHQKVSLENTNDHIQKIKILLFKEQTLYVLIKKEDRSFITRSKYV
jgi:hypothetical protein